VQVVLSGHCKHNLVRRLATRLCRTEVVFHVALGGRSQLANAVIVERPGRVELLQVIRNTGRAVRGYPVDVSVRVVQHGTLVKSIAATAGRENLIAPASRLWGPLSKYHLTRAGLRGSQIRTCSVVGRLAP